MPDRAASAKPADDKAHTPTLVERLRSTWSTTADQKMAADTIEALVKALEDARSALLDAGSYGGPWHCERKQRFFDEVKKARDGQQDKDS
jgi:hypothetical protein